MTLDKKSVKTEPTVKDICRLIVACKENGVVELKLGTLHLLFGPAPASAPQEITPQAAIPREDLGTQPPSELQVDPELADELGDREDVELMVIENPLELERRIASGELIDEIIEH